MCGRPWSWSRSAIGVVIEIGDVIAIGVVIEVGDVIENRDEMGARRSNDGERSPLTVGQTPQALVDPARSPDLRGARGVRWSVACRTEPLSPACPTSSTSAGDPERFRGARTKSSNDESGPLPRVACPMRRFFFLSFSRWPLRRPFAHRIP